MIAILNWFKDRLREPSTKEGILLGLGILGIKLSPEFANAIYNSLVSIYIAYKIFRKEYQK